MATALPPRKRLKAIDTKATLPTPIAAPPKPAELVVIQFTDDKGNNVGPRVQLPADAPRQALEMLVNKLGGNDDEPRPLSLKWIPKDNEDVPGGAAPRPVQILNNLLSDVFKQSGGSKEVGTAIEVSEQAVYRVQPVTRCVATHQGHDAKILCSAMSPSGKHIATGAGDKTCRIWNMDTQLPCKTLEGFKGGCECVEWDPSGKVIATGDFGGHIHLWDGKTFKSLGEPLKGHTKWLSSLSWEPLHTTTERNPTPRLASASADGTVRIWNVATRQLDFVLSGHGQRVNAVRWGGEGLIFTASDDTTIKVWSAVDGRLVRTLAKHAHRVETLSLSTDFTTRTGPFDHAQARVTKKKFSTESEAREAALARYQAATKTTPETLVSGSHDHTLMVWPPQHATTSSSVESSSSTSTLSIPIARLVGHQQQINQVMFSPDGRYIASASFDKSVRIWNGRTGAFISTLIGHVGPVYMLAWSRDSRYLASCSKDTTVKLWKEFSKKGAKEDLPGHENEVHTIVYVGDKVVTGGRDGVVKFWVH